MESMLQPDPDVPPIEQGLLSVDEPQTKWPTVIGVSGIVLSSLGLICGCVGYFAVPLQRWGVNAQKQAGQSNPVAEAQLKIAEQFQVFTIILMTIGMLLTAWMLVGCIRLVRRRRSSRNTLIAWAMASIFMLAVNIAYQILMFRMTFEELANANEGKHVTEVWVGAVIGGCFAVVFGLAFQVFTLIWFSRQKIKTEVARWF